MAHLTTTHAENANLRHKLAFYLGPANKTWYPGSRVRVTPLPPSVKRALLMTTSQGGGEIKDKLKLIK